MAGTDKGPLVPNNTGSRNRGIQAFRFRERLGRILIQRAPRSSSSRGIFSSTVCVCLLRCAEEKNGLDLWRGTLWVERMNGGNIVEGWGSGTVQLGGYYWVFLIGTY